MQIKFNPIVKKFIEFHARSNNNREIYGWLIGYISGDNLFVLSAYSCHHYTTQTLINAEPNPQELSALTQILPLGLEVIGMYHSHPKGVFHSETDDATVLQFAQLFPYFISIVTNGSDTLFYSVKNNRITQIDQKIMYEDLSVKLSPKLFKAKIIQFRINLPPDEKYPVLASKVENFVENIVENIVDNIVENHEFQLPDAIFGSSTLYTIVTKLYIYCHDQMLMDTNQLTHRLIGFVKDFAYEYVLNIPKHGGEIQYIDNKILSIPYSIPSTSFASTTNQQRMDLISKFIGN